MYNLYKFISESSIQEATAPLYTTVEIPDTEVTIVEGEEVVNPVNRTVPVIVSNPTRESFISSNYKELQDGRIPAEEPSETQYIKVTYEDGEKITVNKDLENKEVIQEEKPGEAPENPYMMWQSYTYYTETQVINSWREVEKPITPDAPEYNHDTQYLTYEDDTSAEDKVIRIYSVNEKEVIVEEAPVRPNPEEPDNYWELVEHVDYSQEKVIVKSYTWETTEERRIAMLTSTKREFCLAVKELKGITYTQIMTLVESSENFLMEWREASILCRYNQYLDQAAPSLGLTSEDLDNIFKYINGEINLEELKGE